MDLDSYVSIISSRGDIPMRMTNGYPYSIYALKQDLMSNKVVWVNNYKQDLLFAIKSRHSLLSIFYVPKYHPYTRLHRLIIFISSLCLSVLFSSFIVTITYNQHNDNNVFLNIISMIISASIISIYNSVTKSCLLCSCFENTENKCFQCICKSIGFALAIYIQLFNAIIYLFAGIAILKIFDNDTNHFWLVWNASNLISYFFELIIIIIYFRYRWRYEHYLYNQGIIEEKLDYHVCFNEYDKWNTGQYLNISLSSSPQLSDEDVDDPNYRQRVIDNNYLKILIAPQRL